MLPPEATSVIHSTQPTQTREDAKPYLDQIASEDVCEGKLRDYVWMLSYQHALRMCGDGYESKITGQELLILFPILGSDSCKIPIESIDRILWIESISDIVLNI